MYWQSVFLLRRHRLHCSKYEVGGVAVKALSYVKGFVSVIKCDCACSVLYVLACMAVTA